MNRIDRLVALIILLQSKKLIRGREIAEHFDISLRTVYRDINAICEAGVPVAAETGEGYSIMQGYHLPPIMFTTDEAAALFTGAKFSEYFTDASIKKHALSAITKIKSVLPDTTRNFLDKLQHSMVMSAKPSMTGHFRDDVLATIQDAIVNNLVLKIEYYAVWSDSWSERKIEPLGISYYNNWHIIAWCRLRKEIRDFRADRIRKLSKTDEKFAARNVSFKEYAESFSKMDHLQRITIKVSRMLSYSLKERLFPGFEEKDCGDNKVILTFFSPGLGWLIPLLLSYSTAIEIISPEDLKKVMVEKAIEISEHYSK